MTWPPLAVNGFLSPLRQGRDRGFPPAPFDDDTPGRFQFSHGAAFDFWGNAQLAQRAVGRGDRAASRFPRLIVS
jgi:hypothetical protein